jgi:hypothetical protein
MGGEMATHRTLRTVPESIVFTKTLEMYRLDGVLVMPATGTSLQSIMADAKSAETGILFGHSMLSASTIRAAKKMKLPSILSVHAPPRFGAELRQAWSSATVRLYNTDISRQEWRDRTGWLLHPPIGEPHAIANGPHNALTLTSSLLNKGADRVLELARRYRGQRFIIVESPAHPTHGDPLFWELADRLDNVEVWPRLHPFEMNALWAQTRILLVPSRYETYGMAALEAAWHGIPSVHVDTPHVREGIGTGARLLKTTRIEELAHAVSEVKQDYELWSDRAFDRVGSLVQRESEELARFAAGVASLTPR